MSEHDKKTSVVSGAHLKLGSAERIVVNDQECWHVPHLGIYDSKKKYLGETVEEAAVTLEKRRTNSEQSEAE